MIHFVSLAASSFYFVLSVRDPFTSTPLLSFHTLFHYLLCLLSEATEYNNLYLTRNQSPFFMSIVCSARWMIVGRSCTFDSELHYHDCNGKCVTVKYLLVGKIKNKNKYSSEKNGLI